MSGGEKVHLRRDNEIQAISMMKTVMMLLVVVYHCAALWMPAGWFNQAPKTDSCVLGLFAEWLNYIHIYAFTFASGYLFYYSYVEKRCLKDYLPVLRKRFRRLIVPYIIVSVAWLIPFEIVYFHPTIKDIVLRFVLGNAPRQLWFLLMLFNVNLLFVAAKTILDKAKIKLCFFNGMVLLYLFGIIASVLIRIEIPNLFQILTAVRYLLYFYFGYCFRKYGSDLLNKMSVCMAVVINIGLFYCIRLINNNQVGIWQYATIILTPILCLSGVILSYRISSLINCDRKPTLWKLLERNAFGIYLFHQQIIWIVVDSLNRNAIPTFLIFLVAFFASMLCSIGITEFLKKVKPIKKALQL